MDLLFVFKVLGGLTLVDLFLWFINSRELVARVWKGARKEGGEEGEEFVCRLYQAAGYFGVARDCFLGFFSFTYFTLFL